MNPFEMFGTNENKEVDGLWKDLGDFKVLIARSGGKNIDYFKTLSEESKRLGKATFDALSEVEMAEIVSLAFCKTVIKGHEVKIDGEWEKGVYIMQDGKPEVVPFTVDNMKICLKQIPEYFKQLQEWASDYKTFQDGVVEEQVKN